MATTGKTSLRGAVERKTRAITFFKERSKGGMDGQVSTIAGKYGVSPETVRRDLRWIEQTGLLKDASLDITKRLLPKAISNAEAFLDDSEKEFKERATWKVLEGTGLLSKNAPSVHRTEEESGGELTLERWKATYKVRTAEPTVIDAEPVE